MSETENLLCELIALPSVNPAFPTANATEAGERRVAEFLAATAARAGLNVTFQEVLPGRANLIATLLPGKGKARQRVVLAPHLDTVGVSSPKLFEPQKKNGRIFGRGACDTKGSVASLLSALMEVARSKTRPAETEVVFIGLVDEETGQSGSRALVKSGFKADFAIVGEPTRLEVVTAHKGTVWLWLETQGKAAHSSRPELGRNAVHEMARVVDLIQTEYAAQLLDRRHPLLGHATVSVGSICGGSQPNIVPAFCKASLDRRTLPGENEASVRREIRSLLKGKRLKATLAEGKDAPCLPLETNSKLPLLQKLLGAAGQKKTAGVDYFCDASVLAHGGIPSVAFGPGDIAQAHTEDEWISVSQLERSKAIMVKFLQSLP